MIYNSDIAGKFRQVADLLDIKGANAFRVRAYRNAARTIEELSQSVESKIEKEEDLTELDGIGEDLASKIEGFVKTGKMQQLEDLVEDVPLALSEFLRIPGLGPKRVGVLYRKLDIKSVDDLAQAVAEGRIEELDGFGPGTVEKIRNYLETKKGKKERVKFVIAEQVIEPLRSYLKSSSLCEVVEVAGSYRRKKETVGDIDILVVGDEGEKIIDFFCKYEDIKEVVSKGDTKSTVILRNDIQVDVRVVNAKSAGAAIQYFTGSKEHNIKLRDIAKKRGLKINEYGVYKGENKVAGEDERDIYEYLDMSWIPPELREDRGEIEVAQTDKLPDLITLSDIRGDLQMHSSEYSDGSSGVEEMIKKAKEIGHEYIAVTDHDSYVGVTGGLAPKDVDKYINDLHRINKSHPNIEILAGIEVDILEDGTLFFDDVILQKFDVVVGSIHSHFNLDGEKQTQRLIKAMSNKNINIIGHPTGRKIGDRDPYKLDMKKLISEAVELNCVLEINAHPSRLDLNDFYAKMVKDKGGKLVISTDAHSIEGLSHVKYGVYQARRGWIEKKDVINTYTIEDLRKFLSR
jgi:DNA polymerase (family 10)